MTLLDRNRVLIFHPLEIPAKRHPSRRRTGSKHFRDRYVATNRIGQFIITVYDGISPPLADLIRGAIPQGESRNGILAPPVFFLKHPFGLLYWSPLPQFAGIGMMFYRSRKKKIFHNIKMNPGRTLQ